MDGEDLINFNTTETQVQMRSPLIPLPENIQESNKSRLSDVNSNPFDTLLRKAMKNTSPTISEEIHKTCDLFIEDKENVGMSPYNTPRSNKKPCLISTTPRYFEENKTPARTVTEDQNNSSLQYFNESFLNDPLNSAQIISNADLSCEDCNKTNEIFKSPFKTPTRNRKQVKICTTPLFLSDGNFQHELVRKDLAHVTHLNKSNSPVIEGNNSSLLHESFLNDTLNCALIATNIDEPNDSNEVKTLPITSMDSNFNTSDKLKSMAASSFASFSTESFLTVNAEVSRIPSDITYDILNRKSDDNIIFHGTDSEYNNALNSRRRCMSATKPKRSNINFIPRRQLNNSFGGFRSNDENISSDEVTRDIVAEVSLRSKKKDDISIIQAALDGKFLFLKIVIIIGKN